MQVQSTKVDEKGGVYVVSVRCNIEAERGRMQMTKAEMCNLLGVTSKTYNSYIKGGVIPSTVLETLRQLTGRSIDYLLGLDQQEMN